MTRHGELPDGRFHDPRSKKAFQYDHLRKVRAPSVLAVEQLCRYDLQPVSGQVFFPLFSTGFFCFHGVSLRVKCLETGLMARLQVLTSVLSRGWLTTVEAPGCPRYPCPTYAG